MSAVAEQFAARFDAALRVKPKDKAAQAPYDRLNEFVRKLAKLADVDACLDRYIAIYPRYAKDDPRPEMIFAMLVERRIRMTGPDDDFVDRLYEEVFANRKPSAVAAHIRELEANRRNGILKVLKEARDQRQRRGDLADPLRQMYRRAHDGQPVTSVDEPYTFDPFPDPKLRAEYQRIVDGLTAGWRAAEKQFNSRSYAYNAATEVTEAVRLRTTGYAGFKLRFEAFQEYVACTCSWTTTARRWGPGPRSWFRTGWSRWRCRRRAPTTPSIRRRSSSKCCPSTRTWRSRPCTPRRRPRSVGDTRRPRGLR